MTTKTASPGTRTIMTVLGPIENESLGVTLSHEHIWISLWEVKGRYDYRGQFADEDLLADELAAFRDRGGASVVDLTTPAIGRNPEGLRRISERTGLNIVMGSGWYREPYYRPEDRIDVRSVDDLASEIVSEFENGVGDSGIQPGVIGEIGVDKTWVSAQEERVHRAAARAAIATGMAISTHSIGGTGLAQLAIFLEEGLDPKRVIVGHVDDHPDPQYLVNLLREGAFVSFDRVGNLEPFFSDRTARAISELFGLGFGQQVLLSHDVCSRNQLAAMGGNGYVYIQDFFLDLLERHDIGSTEQNMLLRSNPANAFALDPA